jgi:hypothetical protein
LEKSVVYKINGPYKTQGTGLSCYYPYDMDKKRLGTFKQIGTSKAFTHYYDFNINGKMSSDAYQYITGAAVPAAVVIPKESNVQDIANITTMGELQDLPVTITDDGIAVLTVGPQMAEALSGVYFELSYYDEDANQTMLLGYDNDLDVDWDTGVFKDNFGGTWPAIDGHFVHIEISYEGDDYDLYTIPVLLNGEPYNLQGCYDYVTEEYKIMGARKGLDDNGASDKILRPLRPGDKITTLFWVWDTDAEDDSSDEQIEFETFTVTRNTVLEAADLPDGEYGYFFELVDGQENSIWSQEVSITIEDGEIYIGTDE